MTENPTTVPPLGELTAAVIKNDDAAVKTLLARGANANEMAPPAYQPVLMLVRSHDVAEQLIKHGADVKARSRFGSTMLHNVSQRAAGDIARLLIKHGIDVNATIDNDKTTELMWAVRQGSYGVASILLENGADVNARDKHGNTALMKAVLGNYYVIARLLLEKGADIDAKNDSGHTVFTLLDPAQTDVAAVLEKAQSQKPLAIPGSATPFITASQKQQALKALRGAQPLRPRGMK